ncbi:MAG: metal ABC transporter substrate-binding protein [Actinomycetota bacterium]
MRRILACLFVGSALLSVVSCGGGDDAADGSRILVTHAVLGSVVSELVGDAANVIVLVPNGTDPHEWEPSAKDIERLNDADLVVANGLGLEANLDEVLREAEDAGVPVFRATDHIEVRSGDDHEDDHEDEADHDHAAGDPHFWTDPLAMAMVVDALVTELESIGVDGIDGDAVEADLTDLDAEVRSLLAPVTERRLVTGHESLGYFADRYDFELVGAVIPSLSTNADVTAADLSELKRAIVATGVTTVFTELGTPDDVARAIADETGARVVEISTHLIPEEGTYRSFILRLTSTIAGALTP